MEKYESQSLIEFISIGILFIVIISSAALLHTII